jgi:hypothetical protein
MFEHPISCAQHPNIEGHVLFHIFEEYLRINISADMAAFTTVPIRRQIDILLTIMAIPENHYRLLSTELGGRVHEKCLAMTLEIVRELRASQYSMLAFLSNLPARLVPKVVGSEELACMSLGVINALDLPSGPRVAPLVPGVVSGILRAKEEMYRDQRRHRGRENQAANKEATIAINKLMTHLASIMIFGGQNSRALACAWSWETRSPAVGWLPMHTE